MKKYIDAFNEIDHTRILSCRTDDIEWIMPDAWHLNGQLASYLAASEG